MIRSWREFVLTAAGLIAVPAYVLAQSGTSQSGVSPQTISLPSGPGSIEGLGESFEPQLNSGTFVYRVPLKLPPMRRGAAPSLALEYNSGMGNGVLGMGWRLAIPEIKRQTDRGLPRYDDTDTYLDWTGEELVRMADGTFRCENEGQFARFQRTNDHWLATLPDGTRYLFGQADRARLDRAAGQTYCWKLELSEDLNGNRIAYRYTNHLNQLYPIEIEYGLHASQPAATFRVVFDYADHRPDPVVDYRPRFRTETRLRLTGVTVFLGERRIRHWRLTYASHVAVSMLASVAMFGDERSRLDETALANRDFLPPTDFAYTAALESGRWQFFTNRLDVAPPFTTRNAEFADLNRDGLPDLIYELNGEWFSALNQGSARPFALSQPVANVTAGIHLNQAGTRLVDLTGDGGVELLGQIPGEANYFFREFITATELGPPVDFAFDIGDFQLDDPDLQFVDANHDKAMDVMRTFEEGPALLINRSLGPLAGREAAFYLPPDDPGMIAIQFSQGWQLADMNGDRLLDLVLFGTVNDGGTQVRLTRGLGEFEAQSAMTGGPVNAQLGPRGGAAFNFVDINQDGLSDLVQVESGILRVWLNRDGNRWGAPIAITQGIPLLPEGETTVRFLDLNGNSSTDIVWHRAGTTELLALELHPAAKPHQLRRVVTGMGRGLEVTYKSSLDDMLAAAGTTNEWASLLPFPVQVMGAIEETDGLGRRYRSELSYRNGYYDGEKKEFRGFATAVRRDVGDDAQGAPTLVTEYHFDTGALVQVLKGKPLRVETRTETGAVFHRESSQWKGRTLPANPAVGETRKVHFAELLEVTREVREGLAADEAVTLFQEFDYDDYGNQIRNANHGIVEGLNQSALDDERIVTTEFAINTTAWLLRLPMRSEVTDEHGVVLSRSEFFYDDETFSGNNRGSVTLGNLTLKREWTNALVQNGFIATARTKYDAYGNPITLLDPLASAADGSADFSRGHAREIAYDIRLHAYPVTETIHLGHGRMPLVFQVAYDEGFGTVTNSTDFNTNSTTYGYDTFARLTGIVKPGDTPGYPTVEYDYALAVPVGATGLVNFIETRQLDKTPGTVGNKRNHYLLSRQFLDGLGRNLLSKQEAESAPGSNTPRVVVAEAVQFNARQKSARVLNPYFSLQGNTLDDLLAYENIEEPGWSGQFPNDGGFVNLDLASAHATRTDYDATLRPTQVTNPDGTQRRTVYKPLLTRSFDENDNDPASPYHDTPMVHYNDGLGRLVRVDELCRLNDDGTPAGTLRTWTTRYEYDLNDQLTRITDSQNNVKVFAYDGLMRKTSMNDPDRGVMRFVYNDASNLIETMDAKEQRVTYTYDGANRILTEDYHDEGQPFSASFAYDPAVPISRSNRPDVAYFYDTPVPNLDQGDTTTATAGNVRGALATVWDLSGEEHTSYDARGRAEWVVKRIPDPALPSALHAQLSMLVSYATRFAYDSLDRLTNLTYPDADQLRYEYNDRNLLHRIPGGYTDGQAQPGNILSNILYLPSGQMAQIDYGNGVRTTYAYDSRLRLNNLLTVGRDSVEPAIPKELINFRYDFDGTSNIKSIEDRRPGSAVAEGDPRRNTQLFQYDDLYRVTRVQYSFALPGAASRNDGEINYRYDRIGNMLAQTSTMNHQEKGLPVANLGQMDSGGSAGRWNRTGRAANDQPGPHALTSITPSFTNSLRVYPYDSNGNMTDIDGLVCTWDFKDRLVAVENAEMRAAYVYDYTDRRITKRVWPKVGTNGPSTLNPELTTVSYINKYFEVREHDAPTKYVWNGDTRVARVTGSLNTNVRVQRLRVYPGWNLCSVAVAGARLPSNPDIVGAYSWNSITKEWDPVTSNALLPAGIVLWLQVATNATLTITGPYEDPTDRTVTPIGDFLPSAGLEAWSILSTPNSQLLVTVWDYDSPFTHWLSSLPPQLELQSELSVVVAPGQGVFSRAEAAVQLEVPESALRIRYYHQDHIGSSCVLTRLDGVALEEMANYAFGHARHHIQSRNVSEPYSFTQKETDSATGLQYFEHRYLAANLARFQSTDPLGEMLDLLPDPQKLNLYSYVQNQPMNHIDPDGRVSWSVVKWGATATVVGAVAIAAAIPTGGASVVAALSLAAGTASVGVGVAGMIAGASIDNRDSATVIAGLEIADSIVPSGNPWSSAKKLATLSEHFSKGTEYERQAKQASGVVKSVVGLKEMLDLGSGKPGADQLNKTLKFIKAVTEAPKNVDKVFAAPPKSDNLMQPSRSVSPLETAPSSQKQNLPTETGRLP